MIDSIKVNRFKLFNDFKIDNLTPITLIGGKNNVGKSSLLEAIFTFYDRTNPQVTIRQLAWKGVKTLSISPDAMWAPLFKNFDMSLPIDIELQDGNKKERVRIRVNSKYERKLHIPQGQQTGRIELQKELKEIPTIALDFIYYLNNKEKGLSHVVIDEGQLGIQVDKKVQTKKGIIFPSGRGGDHDEDSHRFGELDIQDRLDELYHVMQVLEPRLKSLSVVVIGPEALIHGDIGLPRKIPVAYMGAGIAKMMSYFLAILTSANGIVLLDEFENGLHYSVLPQVWDMLSEVALRNNCQLFITTHSYEAIKSIENIVKEKKDKISYIRLDRVEDNIIPKYYDPEMLVSAFESDWEIR